MKEEVNKFLYIQAVLIGLLAGSGIFYIITKQQWPFVVLIVINFLTVCYFIYRLSEIPLNSETTETITKVENESPVHELNIIDYALCALINEKEMTETETESLCMFRKWIVEKIRKYEIKEE